MVMMMPCQLKACRLPGEMDRDDDLLLHQQVEIPIDRCQIEIRHLLLGEINNL